MTKTTKLRSSQIDVHLKDGNIRTLVYAPHFFSEYKWSLPDNDYHEGLKIDHGYVLNRRWYKGKKQKRRAAEKLMIQLLEEMTDAMFEDMIHSSNMLNIICRNRHNSYRGHVKLGCMVIEERPILASRGVINKHLVNFQMNKRTIDKINEQHYRGRKYGNIHIPRSLTKDK